MKRLPLFYRKNEKIIASKTCKNIAETLISYYPDNKGPGWMNGLAGISCFFFHYYSFTREEKYKTHGYLALEKILKSIDNGFSNPSFASGLAGVYWVFQYLGRKGFISTEEAGTLDGLKPMLISFAESKFQQGDYDYLHGALGVYTALQVQIANEHFHSDDYLDNLTNTIIRELTRLAIKNPDKSIFWESEDLITGLKEINLGLAHDLPSILLILSRIYACTKNTVILKDLIEPGMNFLLSNRIENDHNFSVFPIRLIDGIAQSPSRMAWCYGDAGISLALMQIGENCSKHDWTLQGISLLKKACSRRVKKETMVSDACLCHGSSGLGLIYYYAALTTGHGPFFETAYYWTKKSLDFGQNMAIPGGYLFKVDGDEFKPGYNMLEGIAGVGLFLMAIMEGKLPGWEQGLLFP